MTSEPSQRINAKITEKRSGGIDLLKVMAAFFVVCIHVDSICGQFEEGSLNWVLDHFFQAILIPAVNIFAIVTGYLMCQKKVKFKKIIMIWFAAFFYAVLIFLFANSPVHEKSVVDFIFPIFTNNHWYLSQYFFVIAISPLLNKLVKSMEIRHFLYFFVCSFILCMLSTLYFDPYNIVYGYSFTWLICMYFVGAFFKKFKVFSPPPRVLLLIWSLSTILMTCSKIAIHFVTLKLFGYSRWSGFFYAYNSVFTTAQAIALFMLFKDLNVRNHKWLSLVSASTFGIYLGQDLFLWTKLSFYNHSISFLWYIPCVLASALIITFLTVLVERARVFLFKVIRLECLVDAVVGKVLAIINRKMTGKEGP